MNNKQTNKKGDEMRKLAMIVGLISVLATSAQAGYWSHTPSFNGGWNSTYFYTPYELLQKYSN
jgi:hypothetical protein|tara:strand:+ start:15 stop:203 length:189 start_codon:yes stop_codon:yes gene_type:complete